MAPGYHLKAFALFGFNNNLILGFYSLNTAAVIL
jgi:hypothetical protein